MFTRREVVEFILDLVGYTPDQPLYEHTLLEPSFGNGDFLFVVVDRLLDAWRRRAHHVPVSDLGHCIHAVELHESSFDSTRDRLVSQLRDAGIGSPDALGLESLSRPNVDTWVAYEQRWAALLNGSRSETH